MVRVSVGLELVIGLVLGLGLRLTKRIGFCLDRISLSVLVRLRPRAMASTRSSNRVWVRSRIRLRLRHYVKF
jgi:hypothetical protein